MLWFEEWFDSPYYHELYCNRDEKEAEAFIARLAQRLVMPIKANVLDAACGKGRHARTLAKLGFKVTGIDLSKNSIAYAKQFENECLKFDVCDIRTPYCSNCFDYVFNLFSSFGYFEEVVEDEKCIAAFSQCLKPGGTLVIDYINSEYAVKQMKPREIVQRQKTQFHIQKRLENGFIKKRIEFLSDGVDYMFEEQLKMINRHRFEVMLKANGLNLIDVFGDYDLNEFNAALSPRLILIAQKTD